MKTLIVGGGVIGIALAYRLATEGVEVELWEGVVDLPHLIGALAHAAAAKGAVIRTFSPVTALTTEGGRVTGVELPDGTRVHGDVVAICTGRWSDTFLARAAAYLPGLSGAAIGSARVALRSIPGDTLPAVGPVPGRPGLYLIVSHGGGTMGPFLGRLAALEIAHGELDPRLAEFRPARLTSVL